MCRAMIALLVAAVLSLTPAQAQTRDETLADIRQELSVLYVEVQRLKRELSTTGGVSTQSVGTTVIDRVGAIEHQLQRLTAKTEELEFRIDRVVRDGSNQIGDLEFRLCELETGCDIATLGEGTTLGGVIPNNGLTKTDQNGQGAQTNEFDEGVQLAVGEKDDFEKAVAALEEGSHVAAAEQFAAFLGNYPGSPLTTDARLMRGAALEGAGQNTEAARAYLDTFSAEPNGAKAPEALYLLGRSLGRFGKVQEACVTLAEVGLRFPGGQAAADAEVERQRLSCQ